MLVCPSKRLLQTREKASGHNSKASTDGTQPGDGDALGTLLNYVALTIISQPVQADVLLGATPKTCLQDSSVYKESLTFSTTKTQKDRTRNQKEHMKGGDTYANHNVLFLLREEEKSSTFF